MRDICLPLKLYFATQNVPTVLTRNRLFEAYPRADRSPALLKAAWEMSIIFGVELEILGRIGAGKDGTL
jgi:hypothetical protein